MSGAPQTTPKFEPSLAAPLEMSAGSNSPQLIGQRIFGAWPGDEDDAQIAAELEALSDAPKTTIPVKLDQLEAGIAQIERIYDSQDAIVGVLRAVKGVLAYAKDLEARIVALEAARATQP